MLPLFYYWDTKEVRNYFPNTEVGKVNRGLQLNNHYDCFDCKKYYILIPVIYFLYAKFAISLNTNNLIRILLADTQPLTSIGIHHILLSDPAIQIAGCTPNLTELAIQLQKGCDILMIDPYFDDHISLVNIKSLIGFHRVIVITNHLGQHEITEAIDAGIRVYLSKSCGPDEMLQAVRSAQNYKKFLCRRTLQALFGDRSSEITLDKIPALTTRETEIIHLIAQGRADKEIAQKLFLSFHTIRTHRKNISKKIGFTLKNAAQLVWLIGYLNDLF
ncbi:MAG: DNA-binding response regulator [Mucilaginibacter sp.]|nr:DNA-binding response regulator [Mucilaginibacter sp.]